MCALVCARLLLLATLCRCLFPWLVLLVLAPYAGSTWRSSNKGAALAAAAEKERKKEDEQGLRSHAHTHSLSLSSFLKELWIGLDVFIR